MTIVFAYLLDEMSKVIDLFVKPSRKALDQKVMTFTASNRIIPWLFAYLTAKTAYTCRTGFGFFGLNKAG